MLTPNANYSNLKDSYLFFRIAQKTKAYLEEHRPGLYERLLLSGRLYDHLSEIDKACNNRLGRIIPAMAAAEGVDEALKARDQMDWVGRMNSIWQRAEEILLTELIFD